MPWARSSPEATSAKARSLAMTPAACSRAAICLVVSFGWTVTTTRPLPEPL